MINGYKFIFKTGKKVLPFFNESGVMKTFVLILAIFHLNVEPEGKILCFHNVQSCTWHFYCQPL